MTARIFLNGRWLPPEEARVPVMDRGFLFGDGVYEVIPVYSRRPFRLEQHLQRLQKSLDGIQLANPHGTEEWIGFVTQLAAGVEWEVVEGDVARSAMLVALAGGHQFGNQLQVLAFAHGATPAVTSCATRSK